MKRLALLFIIITTLSLNLRSQEKFGHALNVGVGAGYYGYYYGTAPALALNYEFDVFKNFTLAPFISIATYKSYRYWGDYYYPYRDYSYRETIIPVGVKGSYYFDELFDASPKWDFYAAASIGVAFRSVSWENGYNGSRVVRSSSTPLFGTLHLGTEYHLTNKVGLFLDISTGFSTLGLGFHL